MSPEPDEIAQAVDALDGISNTLVSRRIGSWDIMIGGGDGLYVLTASSPGRIINAITVSESDDDDTDETVDLTVGEQAIDYPARYVLTRQEIAVALGDLATGHLPAERWEL